jgi:cytochrome c5
VRLSIKVILGSGIFIVAAFWSRPLVAQDAAASPSANENRALTEKGRLVVANACVACHTNISRMVQVHKQAPAEWRNTVYSMIGRGAQVMPDEIQAVTLFLSNSGSTAGVRGKLQQNVASGASADRPAESDAKNIFERNCQQCHDLATASTKQPSEDWASVIARMAGYGARLNSADQRKLIDYLNSPRK